MTESGPGYDKGSQFAKNRKIEPEDWQDKYLGIITSPRIAVAHIQPGHASLLVQAVGSLSSWSKRFLTAPPNWPKILKLYIY